MKNKIRVTEVEDLMSLAINLRNADKEEIYAYTGNRLYYNALLESYNACLECYVWCVHEKPIMIFGVCEGGVVWAMGTDDFLNDRKYFLSKSKELIEGFLEKYGELYNYVYSKNVIHISWLRRVGFIISDIPTELKNGEKFYYFNMKKE